MMGAHMPGLLDRVAWKCDRLLKGAQERLRRGYRRPFRAFGAVEAVVFARQIDFWCRGARVLGLLAETLPRGGSVLDAGSGSQGLPVLASLAGAEGRYRIIPTDMNRAHLRQGAVADAARLPFRDRSVDAAVAMDMLEHVPASARPRVVAELRRVARRRVVVTLPLRSRCGRYDGESADRAFQAWHLRARGYPEGNTAEHLAGSYPELEELAALGPTRIEPLCGTAAWRRYMRLAHAPLAWVTAGLAYWLTLKPADRRPPFHSCLMVWDAA